MIIKSLSRKTPSYKQLIDYVLKEQNCPARPGFERFVLTHNLRTDRSQWHHEFEENESLRIRNHPRRVYCYHDVVSFSSMDSEALTGEMLKTFADEYCRLRGIGLSVAVPHYNGQGNNVHLHIVFSGTEYQTGKALRISRGDFARIKREMQELQRTRFPELRHSLVDHGKKEKIRASEKETQFAKRTEELPEKEQFRQIVERYLPIAASAEEFREVLEQEGLAVYMRGGRLQGILSSKSKRKYRFTSLVGNRVKDLEFKKSQEKEILSSLARIRNMKQEKAKSRDR